MANPKIQSQVPHTNRRSGKDRRQVDEGPPTRVERRKTPEPRQPDVAEIELTESQWGALQGASERD
jgi:hypothetical protein